MLWDSSDGGKFPFRKPASRASLGIPTRSISAAGRFASLPEQVAYEVCNALAAREAEIPWEKGIDGSALHMGSESDSTPMDVPLHPGAERWYREHGQKD